MKGLNVKITPEMRRQAAEIAHKELEFFQCIAHIAPSPPTRGRTQDIKIRGRIVERVRPARFMSFKDGIISDVVRPPSDGERVFLADVCEEDLAAVSRYLHDLYEFCDETGAGISSWDSAVFVCMTDVQTGESVRGYFDGARMQPDGRYRVGIFVPDGRKSGPRGGIEVRAIGSSGLESPREE